MRKSNDSRPESAHAHLPGHYAQLLQWQRLYLLVCGIAFLSRVHDPGLPKLEVSEGDMEGFGYLGTIIHLELDALGFAAAEEQ